MKTLQAPCVGFCIVFLLSCGPSLDEKIEQTLNPYYTRFLQIKVEIPVFGRLEDDKVNDLLANTEQLRSDIAIEQAKYIHDAGLSIAERTQFDKALNKLIKPVDELVADLRGTLSERQNQAHRDSVLNLAREARQQKRWSKAAEYHTEMIMLSRSNPYTLATMYVSRGVDRRQMKQYEKAIADYNKAIQIVEDMPSRKIELGQYYWHRALARYDNDDTDGACSDLRKAARLGWEKAWRDIGELCH